MVAVEGLGGPRCADPHGIVGAGTEAHAVRRLLAARGLAAAPPREEAGTPTSLELTKVRRRCGGGTG